MDGNKLRSRFRGGGRLVEAKRQDMAPRFRLARQIAGSLVVFVLLPMGLFAQTSPEIPGQPSAAASSSKPPPSRNGSGTSNALAAPQADPPDGPESKQQPMPNERQNGTANPVGVAVAPYTTTVGVPASRPAGAVIAPAKQKRARSILIRVGVLIGAGIAIGTVVGLSSASSSRPH